VSRRHDQQVRSAPGRSDWYLDALDGLCRWCHDQTDAPYKRERLVVIALGAGQFTFDVVARGAWHSPYQLSSVSPRRQNFSPSTITVSAGYPSSRRDGGAICSRLPGMEPLGTITPAFNDAATIAQSSSAYGLRQLAT